MWSVLVLVAACGSSNNTTPDAAGPDGVAPCVPNASAPTYTQLYTTYFAPSTTPGHCANEGCHGTTSFNIWSCGATKDSCFRGMSTDARLVNTTNPTASRIIDPSNSPLIWFNQNGFMPADNLMPLPAAHDAILAWVNACAPNN